MSRRRRKRLERRTQRESRRKTLQKCFDALRHKAHKNFVSTLDQKEHEFRAELEAKILVQHQKRVDSLLLYAAELEDKIKMEQDAREQMTKLYDESLQTGFQVFNSETQCLSQQELLAQ